MARLRQPTPRQPTPRRLAPRRLTLRRPTPRRPTPRRLAPRRLARRAVAAGVVGALVVAGGAAAWAANASSTTSAYRTAAVQRASVQQTLTATGSVEPRRQASLAFGISGTVASVPVAVGDHVLAGQTLSRLHRSSLRAAVTDAQAKLAAAKAGLASDEQRQASAAASAAAPAAASTAAASNGASSGRAKQALGGLSRGQAEVVAAQRGADQTMAVSVAALAKQKATCDAVSGSAPGGSAPTASGDQIAACRTALDTVAAAQQRVSRAQQRVVKGIAGLTRQLSRALALTTTTAASATSSSSGSGGGASSTGRAATGTTVTAATLARDQAAIDSARAGVLRAQQQLDRATLVAPMAGTVAALTIARGAQVSSSGSARVVVVGDGGAVDVTINVAEDEIRSVAKGQRATVAADGVADPLTGVVSAIGLLSASTDGTAAYPVTVSVSDAPASLASGSDAGVSLVVGAVHNAVTVPSSAVTKAGTGAVVRVLVHGAPTATRVQVGAVGDVRTQVTSGLKLGQRVVLADLSQPLPTDSTANQRTGFRRGAGFGGGTFTGRGFGAGPVTGGEAPTGP